jgi:hypothetical protein
MMLLVAERCSFVSEAARCVHAAGFQVQCVHIQFRWRVSAHRIVYWAAQPVGLCQRRLAQLIAQLLLLACTVPGCLVAVALLHVCVACGGVVPLSPALVARSEPGRCVGQYASRIRYVARGSWRFPFQANPPRGPSCSRLPRFCARAAARDAYPSRRALRTPVPGEPPAGSLSATNGVTVNLVFDSRCDTQVR